MFNSKRYITAGVNSSIDPKIQITIWNLIENLKSKLSLDYLQVFELSKVQQSGITLQRLVHIQKIPNYRQEYILTDVEASDEKIFVIDDQTHSTMLLAQEY
ncbi:MAG: hypothetical protein K0S61_278 [Anaerocolumna sp.]|jgi:hypothetical protein|nr:hypothetical protein [Anaerocolumna sp.]